jgi:hypothetical protein
MLIQEVLRRENMLRAYKRVVRNGGAPGVDGVTVEQLAAYCRALPNATLSHMGLVSLLKEHQRLARAS